MPSAISIIIKYKPHIISVELIEIMIRWKALKFFVFKCNNIDMQLINNVRNATVINKSLIENVGSNVEQDMYQGLVALQEIIEGTMQHT